MPISYEQFKLVLENDYARRTLGLELPQTQIDFLLSDEAHQIAYFERWSRGGQQAVPSPVVHTDPYSTPTNLQSVSSPHTEPMPFNRLAIWGFVLSLVTMFFLSISILAIAIGGVGALFSGIALGQLNSEYPRRRGRGLAIAGLVIGSVYALASILAIILVSLRAL